MALPQLYFAPLKASDLEAAILIEVEGFPPDEAASLETFKYRQSQAPDYFLGAYVADTNELIGYVCSTLSAADRLTHASMSEHTPGSASVCIHAVCVKKTYRKRGVGLMVLKAYLDHLNHMRDLGATHERVLLITHSNLRDYYEKAGFEWIGPSQVVHGSQPWYEMRKILGAQESGTAVGTNTNTAIPAGLWEALAASSRKPRPEASQWNAFPRGREDVTMAGIGGDLVNKFDLVCPRAGCGSIILKKDASRWVERGSVKVNEFNDPSSSLLQPLAEPPNETGWWLVTPNAMTFENIGFTKNVVNPDASAPPLKFLACAECDLGPLGWSLVGGSEFWVSVQRVSYGDKS